MNRTGKIRTGIASYGMSGKLFHAPFIEAHPGYELVSIVERNKEESRRRYPSSQLIRSFEELITDDSLELIIVNTPVQTHFEYAKAAMKAGKAVVLEKPATVTVKEIDDLTLIAAINNSFLSVYQNRRYDGDYHAVRNVLDQNILGDLKEVEIRYDRYRPQASGKLHKEGALPGAGTLHDLGAHLIDQALQLFGWPKSVFADIRTLRDGLESNDYFEILLYYPGLRVRLKSTIIAKETYWAYVLHGMNGSFLQQRSDMQEEQLLKELKPSLESWCPAPSEPDGLLHTNEVKESRTSTPGNYMGYYDDVYKALREEANNPVPVEDAVKIMQIIEAAIHSHASQKVIDLKHSHE